MYQKSLTTLSSQIVKTKSSLGFLTLLFGLVAGSHAAIANINRQPQLIAGKPYTDYIKKTGSAKTIDCPTCPYKSRPMYNPRPRDPDKVFAPNVDTQKVIAPNVYENKVVEPIFKAPSSH
jgi:hypothetical protein